MPRPGQRAIAAGLWPKLAGCTLLHTSGSTLVAVHPAGEYTVLMLDSTRLLVPGKRAEEEALPTVTYGVTASGSVTATPAHGSSGSGDHGEGSTPCAFAHHTPTHLGDDLLLSVEASSGRYCVLRLAHESPDLPSLNHVSSGDLRSSKCAASSCAACSAIDGCGWCFATGQCVPGDEHGACGGGCGEHWSYGYCADPAPGDTS